MSPGDRTLAASLAAALAVHEQGRPLPGIRVPAARSTLVEQLIESVRRARYYPYVREHREIDAGRADPAREIFDPLLGALVTQAAGSIDEACWLVFLSVHFGRNRRSGWRLARDVYGALGARRWDWHRTSGNVGKFRDWLEKKEPVLRSGNPPRHFGNHRKYQSLSASAPTGTGAAVSTYVEWVLDAGNHPSLFQRAATRGRDRRGAFELLYDSMAAVASFGRTARFDYLTTLGKLALAPIEPGSLFLHGATGPLRGARLLFGSGASTATLDGQCVALADALGVEAHVLEDALCNWQKSPTSLQRFRG